MGKCITCGNETEYQSPRCLRCGDQYLEEKMREYSIAAQKQPWGPGLPAPMSSSQADNDAAPLIVPCRASAKTHEHRIRVNPAGAKRLRRMLDEFLRTGEAQRLDSDQSADGVAIDLATAG